MVEEVVREVIDWIQKNEDPITVCTHIGLCGNSALLPPAKLSAPIYPLVKLGSQECYMCEQLIDFIESWIKDEKTLLEIEKILGGLCEYLEMFEDTVCEFH